MYLFNGRVWKFGDNVSTDLMMPGSTEWGKVPLEDKPKYCMHANRPEFAQEVKPGDIVVAGKNFGCGSSRVAVENLRALGVSCVVAESVATICLRNCISTAFPLVVGRGVSALFGDGDEAHIDARTGELKNLTTGESLHVEPIPDALWKIVEAGGTRELLKKELTAETHAHDK